MQPPADFSTPKPWLRGLKFGEHTREGKEQKYYVHDGEERIEVRRQLSPYSIAHQHMRRAVDAAPVPRRTITPARSA